MRRLRRLFRVAILHMRGRRALQLAAWTFALAERQPDRRKRELLERMARDLYVEGHLCLLRTAGI